MMALEKSGIITAPDLARTMGVSVTYIVRLRRLRRKQFPDFKPILSKGGRPRRAALALNPPLATDACNPEK